MRNWMVLSAAAAALLLAGQTSARAEGNPGEGEKVFKKYCTACHITTTEGPRRLGPTLAGVIGRKSGSIDGFRYSDANKKADIVWTPEVLDKYLTDPKVVVPGTIMAFNGIKSGEERENIISYLATLKK